jgi:erythromycin esterase
MVTFRSINPNDDDFTDLQPLKGIIGDSSLVLLGEPSHGDGACFESKIRLIKFLHQEMGFDVLAFESGFYDCRRAWQAFQSGTTGAKAARLGVFPIWTKSKQTEELWEYLAEQAKTKSPLELVGFDCQFSGSAGRDFFCDDLRQVAKAHDVEFTSDQWNEFEAKLGTLLDGESNSETPKTFFEFLDQLIRGLESSTSSGATRDKETRFWLQQLQSMRQHGLILTRAESEKELKNDVNSRDRQMANNLLWHARVGCPKRKIIVWAASFHIARNLTSVRVPNSPDQYKMVVPMGQHLFDELGNGLFSIGFTTYSGDAGVFFRAPAKIDAAPSGTLESLAFDSGIENGLIPFRSQDDGVRWLLQPLFARPLGYAWMQSSWHENFDAMIFLRTMTPSEKSQSD